MGADQKKNQPALSNLARISRLRAVPLSQALNTTNQRRPLHTKTMLPSLDGSTAPSSPRAARRHPRTTLVAALAALAVFGLAGIAHARGSGGASVRAASFVDAAPPPAGAYKKLGAGLLLIHPSSPTPSVLLLQRKSSHHDKAWGLPGGNAESEDGGSLLVTATREATEEMGGVPSFTVVDRIDVTRGGGDDDENKPDKKKFYAVYVATVADSTWRPPRLDTKESRDARWVALADVTGLDLHPVAASVLKGGYRGRLDGVLKEVKG